LVWKVGDIESFLVQFNSAPPETQNAILDMYHPPLDSDEASGSTIFLKLKSMAATLAESSGTEIHLIHKLLAICSNNAHQYRSVENLQPDYSAIFAYASKMSHSCTPNLAYTSVLLKNNQSALEYKLIRTIPKGQPAAFSYIGGGRLLYQTPTHKRREKLLQTKSFWCKCARCSGPDYCRSIRCINCEDSQNRFIPCIYIDDDQDDNQQNRSCQPTWTCQYCGVQNAEDMQLQENRLLDRLEALKLLDDPHDNIDQLQSLVQESRKILSPVHHITVQSLETLTQWSASKAKAIEHGTSNPLIKMAKKAALSKIAVDSGLQVVVACECVAAGCPGCFDSSVFTSKTTSRDDFSFAHEPIYEMGVVAFQTSNHLMQVPEKLRSVHALAMVQRYLPVMAQMTTDSRSETTQEELQ
jgi:hypothetical protein